MAKITTSFFCQNCGAKSSKWIGKCPSCNEWNTYVEEIIQKDSRKINAFSRDRVVIPVSSKAIVDIQSENLSRFVTTDNEFNRVLGQGIVPGSLILLGGEPGIGKSTLLLQLALKNRLKVLYVSGEESEHQIKMRAERIGIENPECFILTETNLEQVFEQLKKVEPQLLIIDSIQTLYSSLVESAPGTVSQIRECTGSLLRFAKENNVSVVLIGHITKDGAIAGPKVLEHMVDTVLNFEGDRHHTYRILRTSKNRFGSSSEIGIYEMISNGLRQVANPSEILISQREEILSGISIAAAIEGARPLLIETQALVSSAVYGTPQRNSNGFDLRRLNMLLAVLEKRCGFRLGAQDVFINIAGGLRIEDPAVDLSLIAAILSSYENIAIPQLTAFIGEVGLSGEIRAVARVEQRIQEAIKLGFKDIFVSKFNQKGLELNTKGVHIHFVSRVEEVFSELFG